MKLTARVGDEQALAQGIEPFREAGEIVVEPGDDKIIEFSEGRTVEKRGPVVRDIQKLLSDLDDDTDRIVEFVRFPMLGLNALRWKEDEEWVIHPVGPSPLKIENTRYGEQEFLEELRPFATRRLEFGKREVQLREALDRDMKLDA